MTFLPTTRDHSGPSGNRLLDAARRQLGITKTYDSGYTRIAYPGGDIPRRTGVCADVIVRAAREGAGLDLQKLIHEDMIKAFAAYPSRWGLKAPDPNIDHRRVPNMETYWRRQGAELWRANGLVPANGFPKPLRPGDFLTFISAWGRPHVAIVVHGAPLARVIHNMASGVKEQPLWALFTLQAAGHYRWPTENLRA